jgi:hypothetical protein
MTKVVNKYTHVPTPNDVYIGRGSIWGNPFKIGDDGTRNQVIEKYEAYLHQNGNLMERLHELNGKNLVCFCAPKPCHGDILKSLLDKEQL